MSAAYILVQFKLDFFMEENNMNPDQTAPKEQQIFTRLYVSKLIFTSAAFILVHFKLDFIIEENNMNPDQTAPLGAV